MSKSNADCLTDAKLTESPPFSELAKEAPATPENKEIEGPMALPQQVSVDVKFESAQPVSPPLTEDPPPIVAPPVPVVVDPRISIASGSYYMHDMKRAVDDDHSLDAALAKQFKTHIVQLHQNLHEVLEAQSSEKPIAPPKDPCLTQVIGRPG